jgi:hypothetical protein
MINYIENDEEWIQIKNLGEEYCDLLEDTIADSH